MVKKAPGEIGLIRSEPTCTISFKEDAYRLNSLAPGRCGKNLKSMIFKRISQNSSLDTRCEITLRWMPQKSTSKNETLVHVNTWCSQAATHYLNQCWLRSISAYGVTRPGRVNTVETLYNTINFCWSTHKRHSIARPKGRGMGCLLWVQRATYCVDLSIWSSIKYLL